MSLNSYDASPKSGIRFGKLVIRFPCAKNTSRYKLALSKTLKIVYSPI